MSDVDRAIAQIADIRAQLAVSTRFSGYAPAAVGGIGVLSVLITLLQLGLPGRFAANDRQFIIIWGLLLASGFLLIGFEAVVRTLRDGDDMARHMLLSATRIVVPSFLVSAIVPVAILEYSPEAAWIVPGIWQMVMALVAFAAFPSMPRKIVWPGLWFLLSGMAGLFLAGHNGGLTPLMVGGPFIVGHFAIAWVLSDRENSPRV